MGLVLDLLCALVPSKASFRALNQQTDLWVGGWLVGWVGNGGWVVGGVSGYKSIKVGRSMNNFQRSEYNFFCLFNHKVERCKSYADKNKLFMVTKNL